MKWDHQEEITETRLNDIIQTLEVSQIWVLYGLVFTILQEGGHGDIRDRLQALAKSGSEGRRGNNVMSVKLQSNVNRSSHDQKRDKFTGTSEFIILS